MASGNWSAYTDAEEKRIISQVSGLNITPGGDADPQVNRMAGRGRGGFSPTSSGAPVPQDVGVKTNGSPTQPAAQPVSPPPVATTNGDKPQGASASSSELANLDEDAVNAAEKSLLTKILRTKLVTTRHDVEIQRQNPNSPLYSVKSFDQLPLRPELLRGVYAMGFNNPSKIQEATLPALIANPPQNMIAQSQSGTGKTAAFVLTMLSRVDPNKPGPQALCLSPTLELALQTGEVVQKMGKYCPEITMRFVVRGQEFVRGEKVSDHIVIGTPGKVLDWGVKYKVMDLKNVRVFVLDEADVMMDMQGHQDQSLRIHKHLSPDCQMLLFSATYDDDVMRFAKKIVPNPIIMRLKKNEESLDNIKQYYIKCNTEEDKYNAIANIYGCITVGQCIIFCHTRSTAVWLSKKLEEDGHRVGMLTGELTTEQRMEVLDRFRDGKEKVLITTNVMSRGIDIEQVTLVINYDLPVDSRKRADCETYLHRIGRTGRFGKSGIAINLVDGARTMDLLRQIENHFGRDIELLDAEDVDDIEKLNNP